MSPGNSSARPPGSAGADQSSRLHPSALGHVTRIGSLGRPFAVVGIGEIVVPAGRTSSGGRLPGRPSRPPAAARGGASPGRPDVVRETDRHHDAVAHPGAVLIPGRHHRRATAGCRDRAASSTAFKVAVKFSWAAARDRADMGGLLVIGTAPAGNGPLNRSRAEETRRWAWQWNSGRQALACTASCAASIRRGGVEPSARSARSPIPLGGVGCPAHHPAGSSRRQAAATAAVSRTSVSISTMWLKIVPPGGSSRAPMCGTPSLRPSTPIYV